MPAVPFIHAPLIGTIFLKNDMTGSQFYIRKGTVIMAIGGIPYKKMDGSFDLTGEDLVVDGGFTIC